MFQQIFADVNTHMKITYRNTHIPSQLKLATFLRFLATGSYQKSVGNESTSSMSQSAVATIIAECLDIFENPFCHKWVSFERTEGEESAVKEQFYSKFGIPGVIGCVDGAHIRRKSPGMNSRHLFHNRKGYYSLNVMVVSIKCVYSSFLLR